MYIRKLTHAIILLCLLPLTLLSQQPTDLIDSTKGINQDVLSVIKKFKNLKLTGYIQPEFQIGANGNDRPTEFASVLRHHRSAARVG